MFYRYLLERPAAPSTLAVCTHYVPNVYAGPPKPDDVAAAIDALCGRLQCDIVDLIYLAWWDWKKHLEDGLLVLR